jgi:hypothetical protein
VCVSTAQDDDMQVCVWVTVVRSLEKAAAPQLKNKNKSVVMRSRSGPLRSACCPLSLILLASCAQLFLLVFLIKCCIIIALTFAGLTMTCVILALPGTVPRSCTLIFPEDTPFVGALQLHFAHCLEPHRELQRDPVPRRHCRNQQEMDGSQRLAVYE